jgi:hypothetical protein
VCNDGVGVADQGIPGLGIGSSFIGWVAQALKLDDSWDPVGLYDGGNLSLPFGKLVNSVFLIVYGFSHNGGQWHSAEDYRSLSVAWKNRFHAEFYVRFIQYDGRKPASSELRRFLATDRINLHCPLFDLGNTFCTPTLRAAALVHEAWHHWQYEHGFNVNHEQCGGGDCDWFYVHGLSAFPHGQMHTYDKDPAHLRFLSPYQVTVEFLDDIAVWGREDLPIVVPMMARTEGNAVLAQKFRNPVFYRIGQPRPF